MKGLILKPFWGELILNNEKTLECRRTNYNIRGKICIIYSGTGKIMGECEIVDSIKITKENWEENYSKHRVMCSYEELPKNCELPITKVTGFC